MTSGRAPCTVVEPCACMVRVRGVRGSEFKYALTRVWSHARGCGVSSPMAGCTRMHWLMQGNLRVQSCMGAVSRAHAWAGKHHARWLSSPSPTLARRAGVWVSLPWMLHCVCMRASDLCMSACVRPSLSRDTAISGSQFFQERSKDEGELGILRYSCCRAPAWVSLG